MEQDTLMGIDSEQDIVLDIVKREQDSFPPGFWHFIRDNWGIWTRFKVEADKVRLRGRTRYSARTIIEFIRHETSLRENSTFKVNNNYAPGMARLYMTVRECPGLFETRGV
jgi:hypothetical protein